MSFWTVVGLMWMWIALMSALNRPDSEKQRLYDERCRPDYRDRRPYPERLAEWKRYHRQPS